MNQLQELVLNLNNEFQASPALINLLTGLIFAVTLLSMKAFKYTLSSKYQWSIPLYYTACIITLISIGVNRFIGYPPQYPATAALYLVAYLFFCGYILYAGSMSAHEKGVKHGCKTIRTTKNH